MKSEKILLATLATILFITLLTIAAELNAPLKGWLAATFTHHWVGKGILAMALFALLCFAGPLLEMKRLQSGVVPVVLVALLAIHAFFILHFLKIIAG